jgi:non-specific serine/threonine protein kinase
MGFELSGLGEVALRQGDYARAARLVQESLELRRQLGNQWGVGVSLGTLGWVVLRQGDRRQAATHLSASLTLRQEIGDQGGCAWCLERLGEIAQADGQTGKAARLFGAAAGLRRAIGSVIDPADREEYDRRLATLREALGEAQFAAAWEAGRALNLEQAVAYALEVGSGAP